MSQRKTIYLAILMLSCNFTLTNAHTNAEIQIDSITENITHIDTLQLDTIVADSSLKDEIKVVDFLSNADIPLESISPFSQSTPQKKVKKKIKPTLETDPESYHARRAAKWAMLPGGGQIYNKRWWKVPIAWTMIGAGGYFVYNSASNMRTYNKALDIRNSGGIDQFHNIYTERQIITYRNHYRRNLHLSTFGMVGLWSLTILDAVVDAHLKTYDISDNLSLKFSPKVLRVYNNSVPSLSLTLLL